MTSSNDELANLLETLRLRFGVTEELIKNYHARDDGHYVRIAGDEKNATELTPEQLTLPTTHHKNIYLDRSECYWCGQFSHAG